jgi:hypothetical protein
MIANAWPKLTVCAQPLADVCLLMIVASLLQRAKRPILRFKAHEGLLTSAFGEQVKQRYLVFARAVDAYITRLYADWEQVCISSTSIFEVLRYTSVS